MIRKQADGIQWLEFEILAEQRGLVHGVFLRHGGVSLAPYAFLNAGGGSGDDALKVDENRRLMLKALNIAVCMTSKQVHGNEVAWVQGGFSQDKECDALITQRTGLALMIKHADCQAAIIYDPVSCSLANVHSGWRGNVKNIYSAAVEKMKRIFGSKPENLLVGVSPSLGPLYAEFRNFRTEFPEEFWDFQVRPEYFDLWAIARHQLQECGVLAHHIEIASICTYANPQDYFSYRRDKITGRNATVAMLQNSIP
jgi:YfiH family protein